MMYLALDVFFQNCRHFAKLNTLQVSTHIRYQKAFLNKWLSNWPPILIC